MNFLKTYNESVNEFNINDIVVYNNIIYLITDIHNHTNGVICNKLGEFKYGSMIFKIKHSTNYFIEKLLTNISDIIIEDNITAEEKFFGNLIDDNLKEIHKRFNVNLTKKYQEKKSQYDKKVKENKLKDKYKI